MHLKGGRRGGELKIFCIIRMGRGGMVGSETRFIDGQRPAHPAVRRPESRLVAWSNRNAGRPLGRIVNLDITSV